MALDGVIKMVLKTRPPRQFIDRIRNLIFAHSDDEKSLRGGTQADSVRDRLKGFENQKIREEHLR